MTVLVVCLAVVLALALGAVLYLAISLPRRVTRLVLEERRTAHRALAETAALKEATAGEMQKLVGALRVYHDEIATRAAIAREITTDASIEEVARMTRPLRALVAWLVDFTDARYADAAHTKRLADQAPASGPGPTLPAPAVARPDSAPPLPSDPARVAAGLGPRPPHGGRGPRTPTMIGLAPRSPDLGDSGEWIRPTLAVEDAPLAVPMPADGPDAAAHPAAPRPRASAQTLVSMVAVSQPAAQRVPRVEIEHRSGRAPERGAT